MDKHYRHIFNNVLCWCRDMSYAVLFGWICSFHMQMFFLDTMHLFLSLCIACSIFIVTETAIPYKTTSLKNTAKRGLFRGQPLSRKVLIIILLIVFPGVCLNWKSGPTLYPAFASILLIEVIRKTILYVIKIPKRSYDMRCLLMIFQIVAIAIAGLYCIKMEFADLDKSGEYYDLEYNVLYYLRILFIAISLGFISLDVVKFYVMSRKKSVAHLVMIVLTLVTIFLSVY